MRKISNSHTINKHGITLKEYRIRFGRTMSKTTKEKFKELGGFKNFNQHKKHTNIEIALKEVLKRINLNFSEQKYHDHFYFDFFLPDYNIFIEADGVYWHGHDRNSNWGISQFSNIINDYKKKSKS